MPPPKETMSHRLNKIGVKKKIKLKIKIQNHVYPNVENFDVVSANDEAFLLLLE